MVTKFNMGDFFSEFITPYALKILHTYDEYILIKNTLEPKMVRASVLYDLYRIWVDPNISRDEFIILAKERLYYDKVVCRHGIEFYYLVAFNQSCSAYIDNKVMIDALIEVNDPDNLNDIEYVIPAMSPKQC